MKAIDAANADQDREELVKTGYPIEHVNVMSHEQVRAALEREGLKPAATRFVAAHDAALEVAARAIERGYKINDAANMGGARFKELYMQATNAEVDEVLRKIRGAAAPKPTVQKEDNFGTFIGSLNLVERAILSAVCLTVGVAPFYHLWGEEGLGVTLLMFAGITLPVVVFIFAARFWMKIGRRECAGFVLRYCLSGDARWMTARFTTIFGSLGPR